MAALAYKSSVPTGAPCDQITAKAIKIRCSCKHIQQCVSLAPINKIYPTSLNIAIHIIICSYDKIRYPLLDKETWCKTRA